MPIDLDDEDWETATQEINSGDNGATEVGAKSLAETLNEAERGVAYTTVELYEMITGEEPGENDLRAFVPAFSSLKNKNGEMRSKYQELLDRSDEMVVRKKVDEDAGYEGWAFAVRRVQG